MRSGALVANRTNRKRRFAGITALGRTGAHASAVSTSWGSRVRAQYRPFRLMAGSAIPHSSEGGTCEVGGRRSDRAPPVPHGLRWSQRREPAEAGSVFTARVRRSTPNESCAQCGRKASHHQTVTREADDAAAPADCGANDGRERSGLIGPVGLIRSLPMSCATEFGHQIHARGTMKLARVTIFL